MQLKAIQKIITYKTIRSVRRQVINIYFKKYFINFSKELDQRIEVVGQIDVEYRRLCIIFMILMVRRLNEGCPIVLHIYTISHKIRRNLLEENTRESSGHSTETRMPVLCVFWSPIIVTCLWTFPSEEDFFLSCADIELSVWEEMTWLASVGCDIQCEYTNDNWLFFQFYRTA